VRITILSRLRLVAGATSGSSTLKAQIETAAKVWKRHGIYKAGHNDTLLLKLTVLEMAIINGAFMNYMSRSGALLER
jgi:hypothetical protein